MDDFSPSVKLSLGDAIHGLILLNVSLVSEGHPLCERTAAC